MDTLAYPRPWFDEWMRKTGEAPPDLDSLRSMPDLPDLLEFADGAKVPDLATWAKRKEEIRTLLCRYFFGTFPSRGPTLLRATTLVQERERGTIRSKVRLDFDTHPPASVTIETMCPETPGRHPVFLTQTTHRSWAVMGVSRGYLSVVYPASDEDDQSLQFGPIYPECDWRTIPRRAWLAGRVIDYLEGVPEADTAQIAISGHSRNGKQSLIAAAFDERIGSVVSSSSGSAGATPYRFASEREFLESVECTTWMCPDWFHPRLRFFTGREDRLPIDVHGLLGLVAPRHALLSEALNDGCGSSFAVERSFSAAKKAYDLYGKDTSLAIRWRPGGHETCASDIQSYFDWFEYSFGRGPCPVDRSFYHRFSWPEWRDRAAVGAPPPRLRDGAPRPEVARTVSWFLGDEPPHGVDWGGKYGAEKDHDALLMDRLTVPEGVVRIPVQFSEYTAGCLYTPKGPSTGRPVVIWLHPFSFPTGYKGAYSVEHDTWRHYDPFIELPKAGYPVFTFDQLGFGRRLAEGRDFTGRYPRWSKMGKMVRDVRSAIDYLRQGEEREPFTINPRFSAEMPDLRDRPVICVGYSMGAMVALYAAALDERVRAVASFSGFTPMRTDTDRKPTGGMRRWWEWYGLLPRLGLFAGREGELPYDFDDVLSLICPRDCLLVTPVHDRDADLQDVARCVKRAGRVWDAAGRPQALVHQTPDDYSRFQLDQYRVLLDWLASVS